MGIRTLLWKSPALVVKQFGLDSATGRLTILGRRSGLVGFLLSLVGLDPMTWFEVTPRTIRFKSSSLSGEDLRVCPVAQVAHVSGGYRKPVHLLFWAGLVILSALWSVVTPNRPFSDDEALGLLAIHAALVAGLLLAYFLGQTLYLSIETTGGSSFGIAFKRGAIENVKVDIEQARNAIGLISNNILNGGHQLGGVGASQ